MVAFIAVCICAIKEGLSFQDTKGGGARLFEILSTTTMLGVMASSYYFQHINTNDHDKIMKIADNNGLYTKDEKIRLYRRTHRENYTEYVYKIPIGMSFNQFEEKKQNFIDGLNNKSRPDLNLENLKKLNWNRDVMKQIKKLVNNRVKLDKQIEMEYDGMLRFKVYEKGLEKFYLYDDEMLKKLKGWEVPIGYSYKNFIKHDFEKLQMLVVAGMTRYGKTVFLKNAITTLINNNPEDVKFTLIDLKGGLAFSRFLNCKQVLQVAKNESETLRALEDIHNEILKRQEEFLNKGYEDIGEAGYKKRHFIFIDEGAEISGFSKKETRDRCTYLIGEIARLGAGLSYRMIFATQYPTADVFPRSVKSNTSAALCFKLKNATQSGVVLDRAGAEELPAKLYGRAIYQSDQEVIVQTPFIENSFINEKIKPHKKEGYDAPSQSQKPRTTGTNTIKFEEVGLSHKKADSKVT